MKKKNSPKMDWNMLQSQAQDVLGDDFWEDIQELLPNPGPRVDVYETQQEVVVVLEAPGVFNRDQIKTSLKGCTLQIEGQIDKSYPVGEQQILRSERFSGPFKREIELPDKYVYQKIAAKYTHGLLIVQVVKGPPIEYQNVSIEFEE